MQSFTPRASTSSFTDIGKGAPKLSSESPSFAVRNVKVTNNITNQKTVVTTAAVPTWSRVPVRPVGTSTIVNVHHYESSFYDAWFWNWYWFNLLTPTRTVYVNPPPAPPSVTTIIERDRLLPPQVNEVQLKGNFEQSADAVRQASVAETSSLGGFDKGENRLVTRERLVKLIAPASSQNQSLAAGKECRLEPGGAVTVQGFTRNGKGKLDSVIFTYLRHGEESPGSCPPGSAFVLPLLQADFAKPEFVTAEEDTNRPLEATKEIVASLYRDYLLREASPPEIDGWAKRMAKEPRGKLVDAIRNSDEAFVVGAYDQCLGRRITPGEKVGWVDRVAQEGREAVHNGICGSEEAQHATVRAAYRDCLRREPDAGGFQGWLRRLKEDGVGTDQVHMEICDSDEGFVQRQYGEFLGRRGEVPEIDGWLNVLRQHSRDRVREGISHSEEASQYAASRGRK